METKKNNKTKFPNLLNLEGLEYLERKEAIKLLTIYNEGKTTLSFNDKWNKKNTTIKFDSCKFFVYLTNEDAQVAAINSDGMIDIVKVCNDCGHNSPLGGFVDNTNCKTCKGVKDWQIPFLEATYYNFLK